MSSRYQVHSEGLVQKWTPNGRQNEPPASLGLFGIGAEPLVRLFGQSDHLVGRLIGERTGLGHPSELGAEAIATSGLA